MKTKLKTTENATTNRSSISERGHAKNIANFETEIAFCIGYGPLYNPSNPALEILNLEAKWEAAKRKLKAVKDTKQPFDALTGARQIIFETVRPLATRIINALVAQKAPDTVVKDARTIIRKLTGKRASTVKSEEETTISVSQQSYDRLLDNFEELLVLTQTEPLYNPNEDDLKGVALQAKLNEIIAANTAVKNAYVTYSSAMIERNKELYDTENGLVDIALEVKNYVKSLFSASSPQYRQISGLEFNRIKK